MRLSGKRIVSVAVGIVAIIVLFYILGYVWAVRTEPFKVACQFARTNSSIKKHLGRGVVCQLQWTGYSINYNGIRGDAEFAIDLHGSRGDGVLFVKLERHLGDWQVDAANLRLRGGLLVHIGTGDRKNSLSSE